MQDAISYGLFQLQMIISFPFLRAKYLHRFPLIMRTCSFLTLLCIGGTYARLLYIWYKHIFDMIAVLIVFLAVNKKRNLMKKNQDETETRQRRDRDERVLLLDTRIKGNWHSVIVANPSGLLSICCHLRCYLWSLGSVVYPPPTHLLYLLKSSFSFSSANASLVIYPPGPLLIPRRVRCCLWFLQRVVYSSSSTDISVIVAESSVLSYSVDATVVVNSMGP